VKVVRKKDKFVVLMSAKMFSIYQWRIKNNFEKGFLIAIKFLKKDALKS
jgi:hypothetical protein